MKDAITKCWVNAKQRGKPLDDWNKIKILNKKLKHRSVDNQKVYRFFEKIKSSLVDKYYNKVIYLASSAIRGGLLYPFLKKHF